MTRVAMLQVQLALLVTLFQSSSEVSAFALGDCCALECTCDTGLADDVNAAQKDLNKMCRNEVATSDCPSPTEDYIEIGFAWDTVGFSGGNSNDACALFDSDVPADGLADIAWCVSVKGSGDDPTQFTVVHYSCDNTKNDRCSGGQVIACSYGQGTWDPATCAQVGESNSTVLVVNGYNYTHGDPWDCDPDSGEHFRSDGDTGCQKNSCPGGGEPCYGLDRLANLCINTKEMPVTADLIDVCSYPSTEPGSNPDDCVVFAACSLLQCEQKSLKCYAQACDADLGRCYQIPAPYSCSDNITCTTDTCLVQCDEFGCFEPAQTTYDGCYSVGKEYDTCDQNNDQCCEGFACLGAGRKRADDEELKYALENAFDDYGRKRQSSALGVCFLVNATAAPPEARWTGPPPSPNPTVAPPPIPEGSGIKAGCRDVNSPFYSPPPTPPPTLSPSVQPTLSPLSPSEAPTSGPTASPHVPTVSPTLAPTSPTKSPTRSPTDAPTTSPSTSPTAPTLSPTLQPTNAPLQPTDAPTLAPTSPTQAPTRNPTSSPTPPQPTASPTRQPTNTPTLRPVNSPTKSPFGGTPTMQPSESPTREPTRSPTTPVPTSSPTHAPTQYTLSTGDVVIVHHDGSVDFFQAPEGYKIPVKEVEELGGGLLVVTLDNEEGGVVVIDTIAGEANKAKEPIKPVTPATAVPAQATPAPPEPDASSCKTGVQVNLKHLLKAIPPAPSIDVIVCGVKITLRVAAKSGSVQRVHGSDTSVGVDPGWGKKRATSATALDDGEGIDIVLTKNMVLSRVYLSQWDTSDKALLVFPGGEDQMRSLDGSDVIDNEAMWVMAPVPNGAKRHRIMSSGASSQFSIDGFELRDPPTMSDAVDEGLSSEGSGFPWWIIVVIILVLICICLVVLFLIMRSKNSQDRDDREMGAVSAPTAVSSTLRRKDVPMGNDTPSPDTPDVVIPTLSMSSSIKRKKRKTGSADTGEVAAVDEVKYVSKCPACGEESADTSVSFCLGCFAELPAAAVTPRTARRKSKSRRAGHTPRSPRTPRTPRSPH